MSPLRKKRVVPDSSVIIDYERIDRVGFFIDLFEDRILLSDFVRRELADSGVALGGRAREIVLASDEELALYAKVRSQNKGLGPGEAGAIVVAAGQGAVLLVNDGPARAVAERMQLDVAGSLGILKFAASLNKITAHQAIEEMERMYDAGAWFSEKVMQDFRAEMCGLGGHGGCSSR